MCQENILTIFKFLKAVLLSAEKTISLSALGLVGACVCVPCITTHTLETAWLQIRNDGD
jgi:hypothetical protein